MIKNKFNTTAQYLKTKRLALNISNWNRIYSMHRMSKIKTKKQTYTKNTLSIYFLLPYNFVPKIEPEFFQST